MKDASERAVVVDLSDARMGHIALEPEGHVDPPCMGRQADRASADLENDPAALRIDRDRTDLPDPVVEESIQREDFGRPARKVRRDGDATARMRHVPRDEPSGRNWGTARAAVSAPSWRELGALRVVDLRAL